MTEKFYKFGGKIDYTYAYPGLRGTWVDDWPLCKVCERSASWRVPPLIIEWEPGSDIIPDFLYPGSGTPMVTDRVRQAMEGRFRGIEFHPVQMIQQKSLKRPKRITKRYKPRVWLPYEGPPLWDMFAPTIGRYDEKTIHPEVYDICTGCGERKIRRRFTLRPVLSTIDGVDYFRMAGAHAAAFFTENVKIFLESQNFTNLKISPGGFIDR
jgi:hypothetical protein